MSKVYILHEERESSIDCKVIGAWGSRSVVCQVLKDIINNNDLFNENSFIDLEHGTAESDPYYNNEKYCNYNIFEFEIQ